MTNLVFHWDNYAMAVLFDQRNKGILVIARLITNYITHAHTWIEGRSQTVSRPPRTSSRHRRTALAER